MPMVLFAATLVTARAGVIIAVTSTPASTLNPTNPATPPSTLVGFNFWADIASRVMGEQHYEPERMP